MKKLLLFVLVLGVAWVGVNYVRTGQLTLMPAALSEEERALKDLEEELASVNAQIAAAGRTAGMTGMDTTADVESLITRKKAIEAKIAEARKRLP
jgi:hypothetical protein